ncbi:hypothetical protein EV424DRAFT_50198 [Suillus variegatus]|nr:hypothetical protein EV424DRAFT_50198 [Suillus variegatus]
MGKSYVVVVGLEPGIYPNWIECSGQTKKVPGAVYQSFDTYEEALAVWHGALQRGEVRAVRPNAGAAAAPATRIKNEMDGHMYQPVTPSKMDRVASARTVNVQSPQTLWNDVPLFHSPRQMLSPEPPTGVTQYVELQDDPWLQPERGLSPRVTVENSSYTSSSSCVNEVSHLLMESRPSHIRRVESSPTSSLTSIEETTSPRNIRRQATAPASFEMGARYPTIEEIRKGQNLDPRVMIPPSRIFDPANVKPRPGGVPGRRKNGQMDAELTSPRSTTHLVRDRLPAVNYPEDAAQLFLLSHDTDLPTKERVEHPQMLQLKHAHPVMFPPTVNIRSRSTLTIFKKSTRLIGLNSAALLSCTVHQGTAAVIDTVKARLAVAQ